MTLNSEQVEKVIGALKAQHQAIEGCRAGMKQIEAEPIEATLLLSKIEKIMKEALAILTPSESVETEDVEIATELQKESERLVLELSPKSFKSKQEGEEWYQKIRRIEIEAWARIVSRIRAAAREQGAREERNLCVLRADIWIRRNDPDIDLDEHEALCAAIMGDSGKVEK